MTFRKVIFPLAIPGIVAGSIFTFSLTLGDYLTPTLVGKDLFLGNAISSLTGHGQQQAPRCRDRGDPDR